MTEDANRDGRKDVAIYLWPNMFMLDALVPHQILGLMPELNVYSLPGPPSRS
jgi:hypothetical protein